MPESVAPLSHGSVGVVAIGRNEAVHLRDCLASLPGDGAHRVYVDSGSTDGSAEVARGIAGVDVVELDRAQPMSAARARNAGFERVTSAAPGVRFVQFVDGDCVLEPGWLDAGLSAMASEERLGAVWGLLRERRPEASVYNRICDLEWRVPDVGEVAHFGGIVLMRVETFRAAGGYEPAVVASEDHEMSARVRAAGWTIRRIGAPMVTHDARLTRFGEWWRRGVRYGVGLGQLWSRRKQTRETRGIVRAIAWGAVVPSASVACAPVTAGWSLLGLALYPLRVAKIAAGFVRRGGSVGDGMLWGVHCVGSAFPTFAGLVAHVLRRGVGRESGLVEYRTKPRG